MIALTGQIAAAVGQFLYLCPKLRLFGVRFSQFHLVAGGLGQEAGAVLLDGVLFGEQVITFRPQFIALHRDGLTVSRQVLDLRLERLNLGFALLLALDLVFQPGAFVEQGVALALQRLVSGLKAGAVFVQLRHQLC